MDYLRLSKRKYEVTIRIGKAIMVEVHFRAAALYLGLEVSTLGPKLLGVADGVGLGVETDAAGFGAEGAGCFCEAVTRLGVAAELGAAAFDATNSVAFVTDAGAAGAAAALVSGSAAAFVSCGVTTGFVLVFFPAAALAAALGFVAPLLAGVAFASAWPSFAGFLVFVAAFLGFVAPAAAFATVSLGGAVTVSLAVSFIAWAFLDRVVETRRTL